MRAAILETHGSYAVALTEDGRFVKLRNTNLEVGQTVAVRENSAQVKNRLLAYASLAAVLLLFIVGGYKGFTTPYGLVSLDVNPSIEYTINIFDRVLRVDAVNDDGEAILSQIEQKTLLHSPVGDAIDATITQLQANGYLAEADDNYVVLSANAANEAHAEKLAVSLRNRISVRAGLSVESVAVTGNEVEQAHSLGTSAGKLYLIEKLKASSDDPDSFDESEWIDVPVRDIVRAGEARGNNDKTKTEDESCTEAGEDCPDNPGLPYSSAPSADPDNPSNENKSDNASKDNSGGNSGNPSGKSKKTDGDR
jgi:hypothetical protein